MTKRKKVLLTTIPLALVFKKLGTATNGGALSNISVFFNYSRFRAQIDEMSINTVLSLFCDKGACFLFHTLSLIDAGVLLPRIP